MLQQHGPAGLHAALLSAAGRPLADLLVDERIDRYADQLRWPEGQLAAGRSAAAVVVTMPTDQIGRPVVRMVARLHLPASTVTGMVIDALTAPDRNRTGLAGQAATVQQPELTGASATSGPLPDSSPQVHGRALSPAQRAQAGFPAPLHVAAAAPVASLGVV